MKAVLRYFRWQIGTRIVNAPIVMPFIDGTSLVCERSQTGATGNVYCGLHEFEDMAFLLHFLRPCDTFWDIGANLGSFTVLASGVVGARSIACEPVPSTFKSLTRNIQVNGIQPLVQQLQVAIGDRNSHLLFSTDQDTVNKVVDESYRGAKVEVAVSTLDQLHQGDSPALWKVDVEGFEEQVLAGATESLRRENLKAVELEGDSEVIAQTMRAAGFRRAIYHPFERQLMNVDASANKKLCMNNLWIKDWDFVAERCKSSRIFRIHDVSF